MTRTWPVPRVPGEYAKRPTFLQRIQSGIHPVERRRLQVGRDEDLCALRRLDEELEALSARRVELLDRLEHTRDQLWPEAPFCKGRRPPALDRAPLPPMAAGARVIGGRELRGVCLAMLARCGALSLPDIHARLHTYGYRIEGEYTVKVLADAMAYEVRCGRAVRVRRGVYDVVRGAGRGRSPGGGSSPDPRRRIDDPTVVAPWSEVPIDPAERTDPDRWIPEDWPDPPPPNTSTSDPRSDPTGDPRSDPTGDPRSDPTGDSAALPTTHHPTTDDIGSESAQNRPRQAPGGVRVSRDEQVRGAHEGVLEALRRAGLLGAGADLDSVAEDASPP